MNPPKITIQVNFKTKPRGYEKVAEVKHLYIDRRSGRRVMRKKENGRIITHSLNARTDKAAEKEIQTKLTDHYRAQLRIDKTVDPFARNQGLSVSNIAVLYIAAGCPTRKHVPRADKELADFKSYLAQLTKAFGSKPWDQVDNDVLRGYHAARTAEIQARYKYSGRSGEDSDSASLRRTGNRTVELEFDALTSLYKWAMLYPARTGITRIPFTRIRYRQGKDIRHCRENQPASGDEFHEYASALMEKSRSEVQAWQMLFEGWTGQRTHEVLAFRSDATNDKTPGYVRKKIREGREVEDRLYLYRSPTHKGTFQYLELDKDSRSLLLAFRLWHARRYPASPWMFPNYLDPSRPADKNALTKALARLCEQRDRRDKDGNRRNITSHGLRSLRANVWRNAVNADGSEKHTDGWVAERMGHKSTRELKECYGEPGDPISLMPSSGKPAWHKWLPHSEHHWTAEKASDFTARHAAAAPQDLRGKETLL